MRNLTPKQARFVNEYCVDENATQAARRAGYSENGVGQTAHNILKLTEIQEAIAERMREIAVAASITPEWVVSQWANIARADPNELTQLRRGCCRYCHGYGHQYQWTEAEYAKEVDKAIDSGKTPPDGMGGFGFNLNADPHPDCSECGGLGIESTYFADTRKLTNSGKALFAGVQKTKDGLKILMRDKDAATLNLARYLGMLIDRKELSGPGGGPVPLAHITAEDLTDDQLAALLKVEESGE